MLQKSHKKAIDGVTRITYRFGTIRSYARSLILARLGRREFERNTLYRVVPIECD
jgi:hypothetical protein